MDSPKGLGKSLAVPEEALKRPPRGLHESVGSSCTVHVLGAPRDTQEAFERPSTELKRAFERCPRKAQGDPKASRTVQLALGAASDRQGLSWRALEALAAPEEARKRPLQGLHDGLHTARADHLPNTETNLDSMF